MTQLTFTNPYGAVIAYYTNKNGDKCFKQVGTHFSKNNGRYAINHGKNITRVLFDINLDDIPF